jgi:hypothetical protein
VGTQACLLHRRGTHAPTKGRASIPTSLGRFAPMAVAHHPYPFYRGASTNGRETLGLRPALRQAAPGRRRGRGGREAAATRQRDSGFGQSHDRPPAGDSLREFVLHSLRLRPWRHSGRGLPTRHSLRERRLPLDVMRDYPFQPYNIGRCAGIRASRPPIPCSQTRTSQGLNACWPTHLYPGRYHPTPRHRKPSTQSG